MIGTHILRDLKLRAQERRADFSDQFLGGVGLTAEAFAERAIEPVFRAGSARGQAWRNSLRCGTAFRCRRTFPPEASGYYRWRADKRPVAAVLDARARRSHERIGACDAGDRSERLRHWVQGVTV